jgi:hypothetical protein
MATERVKLLALHAIDGGFRGDALQLSVAVALAESGGNFDAGRGRTADRDSPRPGCGSYGAWQINSCPARDGDGPPRYGSAPETLLNPRVNARAAFVISSGGSNWRPWSTYQDGLHKPHMREAADAVEWLITPAGNDRAKALFGRSTLDMLSRKVNPLDLGEVWEGITNAAGDPLGVAASIAKSVNPLQGLSDFAGLLTSWATWRRVLYVLLGLVLIAAAVALLAGDLADRAGVLPVPRRSVPRGGEPPPPPSGDAET